MPFQCGICKSDKIREQIVAREMCKGTRHPFNYVLCGGCGTLQLTNPPADYGYYYEGYYSLTPVELKVSLFKRNVWKTILLTFPGLGDKVLERYGRSMLDIRSLRGLPRKSDWTILDVGAGKGDFVNLLSQLGFKHCVGCDPFLDRDIQYASGARVVKSRIDNMQGQFDLVMMHHAIEHVPDPANVFHHLARLMSPAGYCILRFPNINSAEFLKYKGNWSGIHAPYHTYIYSASAISQLAEANGLCVEKAYCDSRADLYMYSSEYSLDIDDRSPFSTRQGAGMFCPSEIKLLEEKAIDFDRKGMGDWIVYILRHANPQK